MRLKYWIIYTDDYEITEVLWVMKRGYTSTIDTAKKYATSTAFRKDHHGNRLRKVRVLGPFFSESEVEQEIIARGWKFDKPDKTTRILFELEKMIKTGGFSSNQKLKSEIEELIMKVSRNQINLLDYRRADSREKYGDIVDAIDEAVRQLEKRFGGEKIE